MSGPARARIARSTQTAPNASTVRDLAAAYGTAANSATTAGFGSVGTTTILWSPNVSNNTQRSTLTPAAALGIGYRDTVAQDAAEQITYEPGTWTYRVRVSKSGQTLSTNITVRVTVVVYQVTSAGVFVAEVGRITMPDTTVAGVNVASTVTGAFTTAGPVVFAPGDKVQVETYVQTISLGAPAAPTGTTNVHLVVDEEAASGTGFTEQPLFTTQFARTATDLLPRPADTASRAAAVIRTATDLLPRPADVAARVAAVIRAVTTAVPAPTDVAARVAATVRTATDLLPRPADAAARVATASRTAADVLPTPAEAAVRALAAGRLAADVLPTPTDVASKTALFPRQASDLLPRPTDTATRVALFPRTGTDLLPRPVDVASRAVTTARTAADVLPRPTDTASRLYAAGRTVTYRFQPSDEPLLAPTRAIAGVVRLPDGAPYLGGATVKLFRNDDVKVGEMTSSLVDGSYSFPRNSYDTASYYVAFFTDGVTPRQAVTERGLAPT